MRALAATIGVTVLAAPGTLSVGNAIPVGKHPAGLAVAAGSLWLTNDVDNTVSQVSPATNTVTRTVHLRGRNFPDPSLKPPLSARN